MFEVNIFIYVIDLLLEDVSNCIYLTWLKLRLIEN